MAINVDALRDRYRGALLASAAGDALGATLEFLSREDVRERHGVLRDITGGGWLNLRPGEVTDDTQMACCIAHSIVDAGRFDADDVAERFVAWFRSNPPDIGNTTRHALAQLDRGVPWREAGWQTHLALRPRDASNGSVMRAAPVALLARGDAGANARHSADSSRITHANPLCVASCVALNAAIAALLDDPHADPVAAALDATGHAEVRDSLAGVRSQAAETLDASGYVLATLQSALWAVTAHDNLEQAVIAAVNLGQDADTTGAVAGALAGARWGLSAMPPRWLAVLDRQEELIALADGLLALSLARRSD
ncbi:MAG TPA: ADP-ribosylglycohydrolase family protein [Thermomicrobiales bacterium]|nr:ADP-ribosylglycohydrolase family protein [Thermomicrobiales bacterium]